MNRISEGDVIVYVKGGCVQAVISNREGLRVMLVDYDNEEAEPGLARDFVPIGCNPGCFTRIIGKYCKNL